MDEQARQTTSDGRLWAVLSYGGLLLGLCYFDMYNSTRPLPD